MRRLIDGGQEAVLPLLLEIFELEAGERRDRRVERLRRASRLPPGKTFDTLDEVRLPRALVAKLRELRRGDRSTARWPPARGSLPGVGKSHGAAALGHALVDKGHSVLFTPAFRLVQDLLVAKRDLKLTRALRALDAYELLILDDIGYVQQGPDEVDVLFTLMAERHERRSMLITSSLVFNEWSRIFKDPMTTAAAIDRVVHHSVILEFDVPSYRTETAKKVAKGKKAAADSEASDEAKGI